MSVPHYADRFVANLLSAGLVTCWTMSAVDYFGWLGEGVAGMPPQVAQACLVAMLVTVVLVGLPWLRHVLARSRHTPFVDAPTRAGAWRGRLTGVAFGMIAAVSIISQSR